MPFIVGDDNGNVKHVRRDEVEGTCKLVAGEDLAEGSKGKQRAIQVMTFESKERMLAVSRADGTSSLYSLEAGGQNMTSVLEWSEARYKPEKGHQHVGLSIRDTGIYSCTSSGHVRRTALPDSATEGAKVSVPTRLTSFEVSPSGSSFAYGGDEVDLSIWDSVQAFSSPSEKSKTSSSEDASQGTKRKTKTKTDLFPGEIWRAKNLPNDSLNLRQPIHITALTYLSDPNEKQLATGTYTGAVRRYDIRTARRPIANWEKVIREGQGGVSVLKNGLHEHELFLASSQSTVSCLDLRNGRLLYSYKGISGAVNSLAPSGSHIVSTSLDRLVRLHSTSPPPQEAGGAREDTSKPAVLDKLFWKFTPTVVCWDGEMEVEGHGNDKEGNRGSDEDDDEEMWNEMGIASDDDSDESKDESRSKAKRRKRA